MEWAEIDWQGQIWTIPGAKTKNSRQHRVPLAPGTIAILQEVKKSFEEAGKPLMGPVFSTKDGQPISGFSKAKVRLSSHLDIPHWTIHDLRRTFATLASEHLSAGSELLELCLNHKSGTRKGPIAVYVRAENIADRARLFHRWEKFILMTNLPDISYTYTPLESVALHYHLIPTEAERIK